MNADLNKGKPCFCVFMDTIFQGPMPATYDAHDKPCVYETELEAQKEIADFMIMRLQAFLDGNYDFEGAMSCEDFVRPVTVFPDGSIMDEDGRRFPKPD